MCLALYKNHRLLGVRPQWCDLQSAVCFPMAILIFGFLVMGACTFRLLCAGVHEFRYVKASRVEQASSALHLPSEFLLVGSLGCIGFVGLVVGTLVTLSDDSLPAVGMLRLEVLAPMLSILINVLAFFCSCSSKGASTTTRDLRSLVEKARGDEHFSTIFAGFLARQRASSGHDRTAVA